MTEIDNKLGLQVVPPVRVEGEDIEAREAEAEANVGIEDVDKVYEILEAQNAVLVNRLGILGKSVNPLMLLKIQVDTLIDFTFGEEEARKHYETACSMRLNETLKVTLAKLIGADLDES